VKERERENLIIFQLSSPSSIIASTPKIFTYGREGERERVCVREREHVREREGESV
jgi:hypothetical protein